MHGRALEGVVVVLAMGGGAVDQRRPRDVEAAAMAEGGAAPLFGPGPQRRPDIVLIARGDRQADMIQQRVAGGAPHRRGDRLVRKPRGPGGEDLRHRGTRFRERILGHISSPSENPGPTGRTELDRIDRDVERAHLLGPELRQPPDQRQEALGFPMFDDALR
jgi:hypothetical protein